MSIAEFNAGQFLDVAATSMGQELWALLNTTRAIDCMKTTTYLGRPAVEGLQPLLLEKFSKSVIDDRYKQMIGKMVRQIIEREGYTLDQSGVRTRTPDIFLSGSRYKKSSM